MLSIHPLSWLPLAIELYWHDIQVGCATGFVVEYDMRRYLITNWHVVTSRDPLTGQPLREGANEPTTVRIWHHVANQPGRWDNREESLYNDRGGKLWLEHPRGREVDIIAIPLTDLDGIETYPLDLGLAETDMYVGPSDDVSIIGFPLAMSSWRKLPIWRTGHLAMDYDVDYSDKPSFLVDIATGTGMSGAPVFAIRTGGYQRRTGGIMLYGGMTTRFLGIHSSRHSEPSLAIEWKPQALFDVLKASGT